MGERAFGEILREFRVGAGLSQEELAERARLSPGAISALERSARRGPQHQTLSLLAEALQLAPDARARFERAAEDGRRRGARGANERPRDASADRPRTNLPSALTSFHGRDRELGDLARLLRQRRLVTLLGTGGVGKTRLALEAARRRAATEPASEIWFVDLTHLAGAEPIAAEIARLVDVREVAGRSMLETLAAGLAAKRLTLILDNCEHAVEPCALVAETLLAAAPELTLLTTTREALRVDGETIVRLEPLPCELEQRRGAALDLFLDRLSGADFTAYAQLSDKQLTLAATICRRLDGIPLALELAAGRARELSLAEIARGLDERFDLLAGGRRGVSERHSTLRATIDWSYEPLDDGERAFFARLGLFAGSFTSESAVAVCGDDDPRARSALIALIAKSLIAVTEDGEGRVRYRLLESMRAFALERLRERGEADVAARRFAEHYVALARAADARYGRILKQDFLAEVEPELENFRAALEWSLAAEHAIELGADLAGAAGFIFRQTSLFAEGVLWAERALRFKERLAPMVVGRLYMALTFYFFTVRGMKVAYDAAESATDAFRRAEARGEIAWALTAQAYCAFRFGDGAAVQTASEEAVRLARAEGDDYRLAGALNAYALSLPIERSAERFAVLEEAIRCSKSSGDADAIVPTAHLSGAYQDAGEFEKALICGREVVALARKDRDRATLAATLGSLASYALATDRVDEAEDAARESLQLVRDLGKSLVATAALEHLGSVAARRGDAVRAARLCGASNGLYREFQIRREKSEAELYDRTVAEVRHALGEAGFVEQLAAGEALPIDAAIGEALAPAHADSHSHK